ncbi:hypothetical protein [Nonomuraea sp. NPDC049625]|uniref:hypothetical protein n=1 Tax=Nonomuraea sp. NPDC049625 TaxID=3155775 RepID=UPI0034402A16
MPDDNVAGDTDNDDTVGLARSTRIDCHADHAPESEFVEAAHPWIRNCTNQPSWSFPDGTSTDTREPDVHPAAVIVDQISPVPCAGTDGSCWICTLTPTPRPSGSVTTADNVGCNFDVTHVPDDNVAGDTDNDDTVGLARSTRIDCHADHAPESEFVEAAHPWIRNCTNQPSWSFPDGTSTDTREPDVHPAAVIVDQISPVPCAGTDGSCWICTLTPTPRPSGSVTTADNVGCNFDVTHVPDDNVAGDTDNDDTIGPTAATLRASLEVTAGSSEAGHGSCPGETASSESTLTVSSPPGRGGGVFRPLSTG